MLLSQIVGGVGLVGWRRTTPLAYWHSSIRQHRPNCQLVARLAAALCEWTDCPILVESYVLDRAESASLRCRHLPHRQCRGSPSRLLPSFQSSLADRSECARCRLFWSERTIYTKSARLTIPRAQSGNVSARVTYVEWLGDPAYCRSLLWVPKIL